MATVINIFGYPSWNRQIEAKILFKKMGHKKVFLALEVGCGTAPFTAEMAFRGKKMVGLDIDSSSIALANKRYGKDAEFILADASRFPFRGEIFNIIFAISSIEHFKDIENFLSNSYNCLRNRGELMIITDRKLTAVSNIWKMTPKILLKKEVREMMKMDLSINQIPFMVHKNKYSVIQYFDCKDTSMFESQGFHIKECEHFICGIWALLFQAYHLINGLTFMNTAHRLISIILNPFIRFTKSCPNGVGIYIGCIKGEHTEVKNRFHSESDVMCV